MNMKTELIYESIGPIKALNNVPGFDPRRFLRRTVSDSGQQIHTLDLRYRKLWFRLKYPEGRIMTRAISITSDAAIFETRVYFERSDSIPGAMYTATCNAAGQHAALYVQHAQDASVGGALNDAGFGLQFCDISDVPDIESTGGEVLQKTTTVSVETAPKHTASGTGVAESKNVIAQQKTEITSPAAAITTSKPIAPETTPAPVAQISAAEDTAIREIRTVESIKTALPAETSARPVQVESESVDEPEVDAKPQEVAEDIEKAATESPAEVAAIESVDTAVIAEASPDAPRFTTDMPADEILKSITSEEAAAVVVDFGLCKGKTLAEVAETRMPSLKFFATGYNGENNLVRAAARVLCDIYESVAA